MFCIEKLQNLRLMPYKIMINYLQIKRKWPTHLILIFPLLYCIVLYCQGHRLAVRATLNTINSQLHVYFERIWREKLNTEVAVRGQDAGGNKLRTYRKFKENYDTEQYVKVITQKRYRSAYAKFRCGVAPIKLETCRYGLNRMPVDQRLCESCNVVEDECHVIMHCSLYDDIRTQLFTEINNISDQFPMLSTDVQFLQIMSNPQYYRSASRAMHNILNRRRCNMLR